MPDRPRYVAAGAEPPITSATYDDEPTDLLPNVVRFDERGLVPAIVQDIETGAVLMLAYMNRQSLELTVQTGQTHFWSRSRNEIWHKGATSGNYQHVLNISVDCDGDTLLLRVRPDGPACHTGEYACFYRTYPSEAVILPAPMHDGFEAAEETTNDE